RDGVDPRFELSRYGERLAASAPSFEPLRDALEGPATLVDTMLDEIARELVAAERPDLVGLTVPFPGNVYGAFRLARAVKAAAPATRVALGGGYVNTELRQLPIPASSTTSTTSPSTTASGRCWRSSSTCAIRRSRFCARSSATASASSSAPRRRCTTF